MDWRAEELIKILHHNMEKYNIPIFLLKLNVSQDTNINEALLCYNHTKLILFISSCFKKLFSWPKKADTLLLFLKLYCLDTANTLPH